jgi:hypothetical protein
MKSYRAIRCYNLDSCVIIIIIIIIIIITSVCDNLRPNTACFSE